ncbi:unnamed protein product [Wuchereria bancrofti]|nr:unnamed protein product [Wuchereria bancrofti]
MSHTSVRTSHRFSLKKPPNGLQYDSPIGTEKISRELLPPKHKLSRVKLRFRKVRTINSKSPDPLQNQMKTRWYNLRNWKNQADDLLTLAYNSPQPS